MLPDTTLQTMVHALVEARRTRRPWRPEHVDEALTLADAYRVQAAVAQRLGWFPDGPRAWKVGGQPTTAAPLPAVLSSPAQWPHTRGNGLLIEAELAFRLARTPRSEADIRHCLGSVCVSIELVDTRLVNGLNAPAAWKLADQGVHAGLVLGAEQPCGHMAHRTSSEWSRQTCEVAVNGQVVQRAQGSHPMGDPLFALPWLVTHAATHTGGLRAGDWVTTGAWLALTVQAGDRVEVRFDGVGTATLEMTD